MRLKERRVYLQIKLCSVGYQELLHATKKILHDPAYLKICRRSRKRLNVDTPFGRV